MARHSFEFKMKMVKEYLSGMGGYGFLCKQYGIPDKSQLRNWVENYKTFGEEGLQRSRKNRDYSFQFKKDAIELYLSTEISYRELAIELGITNPPLIAGWVRKFRAEGLEGLSKPKGRPPKMKNDKKKKETNDKHPSPRKNDGSERMKELENQVLSLQIQNAFLKELRSLQTKENQKQTKKPPKLSTDSDKNSN